MRIIITSIFILFLISGCGRDAIVNPGGGGNGGGGVNNPPGVPYNPNPADGTMNAPRFITLSWSCEDPDGDSLKYDVIISQTNPPSNIFRSNYNRNIIDVGLTASNMTFFWKIIAKDNRGGFSESPVWTFTTGN